MSASHKKKLRQEQMASGLTEKQMTEKKEARRLKIFSISFIAAIILMVCVVIVTIVFNSGIIERHITALKVDDHKVSSAELNYFFLEAVNNFYSQYGSYASMLGLDTTVALDQQEYAEGTTWADYFVDQAKENARSTYALYDAAKAEGYVLSEDEKSTIEDGVNSLQLYASYNGYSNVNSYIKSIYGRGCNEKTYRAYRELAATATAYYNAHLEGLTYTDADYRAKEADNYNAYSSFSYSYYLLSASTFYEGGTEDADGNTTYSDEEKAAGLAAAEAAAKEVANASISLEAMNEAIAALEINSGNESAAATTQTDVLYSNVPVALQSWLSDSSRTAGDASVVPVTTTDADGNEVITGYYVVYFESVNDNTMQLVNVRHILVPFEGGETDENGNTTYSDEDYQNTEASAQLLLDSWDGTEEGFATLAEEKSTDTGSSSNGGLYENVYPGQMTAEFNNWCFDPNRQVGDTGLVKTDYGYHVMYFCGNSDTNYRDYMIDKELRNADMESWYQALLEPVTVEAINVKNVNGSLILSPNNTNNSSNS